MVSNRRGSLSFDMSETTLGAELRKARGTRKLEDMSELTGVDVSLLSRIENNRTSMPKRETLTAISRGYGLPLEYLAQLVYCGKAADQLVPA